MSQTQEKKPEQPAVVRAEEVIDRAGHRIGLFLGLTVQRMQSAATSLRGRTTGRGQPQTEEEKPSQPAIPQTEKPATLALARAEQLVDAIGQRLGLFAVLVGLQAQKAAARAREEAEDVWAEAQTIYHENSRTPQ